MGEDANPAEPDGRIGILPYGKSKLPRGVQPGGSGLPLARSKMEPTAVIRAGGLGTRLRPAVADRPKVLAPVNGRPFLAFLLDRLVVAGFGEAVLLVGHGADQVREAFGDRYRRLRLRYSAEQEPLGTAGA